tara:strand:- start:289 stop:420 length:132 start_codon:yes stop_codon:yes gene_type:complete
MPELPDFLAATAAALAWLLLLRTIVRLPRKEKASSSGCPPEFL